MAAGLMLAVGWACTGLRAVGAGLATGSCAERRRILGRLGKDFGDVVVQLESCLGSGCGFPSSSLCERAEWRACGWPFLLTSTAKIRDLGSLEPELHLHHLSTWWHFKMVDGWQGWSIGTPPYQVRVCLAVRRCLWFCLHSIAVVVC